MTSLKNKFLLIFSPNQAILNHLGLSPKMTSLRVTSLRMTRVTIKTKNTGPLLLTDDSTFQVGSTEGFAPWLAEAEKRIQENSMSLRPKTFDEGLRFEENACHFLKDIVKGKQKQIDVQMKVFPNDIHRYNNTCIRGCFFETDFV